ncbi:6-bladed beta-propeller [bacterium]|nr:6-bladed beta-propeller [bacterium]
MKQLFLTCLSIMVITACGKKKPQTYTTGVIDGITHIHNLEPSLPAGRTGIRLAFIQRYGALETDDPDLLLNQPSDAAVDRDGNVFITDKNNHQLKKFDSSGHLLYTLGRRGQGPDDFMYPRGLLINDENQVMVTEFDRTKVFSAEGEFLRILEIKGSTRYRPLTPDRFIDNGMRMVIRTREDYQKTIQNTAKLPMVSICDSLGTLLCEFGTKRVYDEMVDVLNFNAFSLVADRNDHYYMAFESQNRIEKYGPDGSLIWRADRKLPYEESTEIKKVRTSNRLGSAAIAPMYNRFSRAIEIDGQGRLWIPTHKRQFTEHERLKEFNTLEDPEFIMLEVYNRDGILLQRIPWEYGTGRQLVHIHGDRMFFTSWVDMCVYEYRIIDDR